MSFRRYKFLRNNIRVFENYRAFPQTLEERKGIISNSVRVTAQMLFKIFTQLSNSSRYTTNHLEKYH